MRTLLISGLFILTTSILGFSQAEPSVTLIEGEVLDTAFSNINGGNFGFKIDWGQNEKDTCKYEFFHARESIAYFRSSGYFVGKPEQFRMYDVSSVRPGDRFVFNLELNGRKIYKSYHVLSIKNDPSENKPWFFNIYFLMDGDTVSTENYQVYFSYPADSTNTPNFKNLSKNVKWSLIKPPALKSENFSHFIRYYFTQENELPPSIVINYEKYQLTFEFHVARFYHGDIFTKFSPKQKIHDNNGYEFNSAIEFMDKDKNVDGRRSSTLFNHYYKEEKSRRKRAVKE